MACILSGARYIPQRVFLKAAQSVAAEVSDEEIRSGKVYPDLERIREVSIKVAADCMDYLYSATSTDSIASFMPEPMDKEKWVRDRVFSTDYPDLSPNIYEWDGDQHTKFNSKKIKN